MCRLFSNHCIPMSAPFSQNDPFEFSIILDGDDSLYEGVIKLSEESKYGITCYSETATNLLLWAHYADKHKGVVLGFDANHSFFENLKRVKYVDRMEQHGSSNFDIILQKSDNWIYEKEWRQVWEAPNDYYDDLVKLPGDNREHLSLKKIPMETITELIYGIRYWDNEFLPEDVYKLKSSCNSNFANFLVEEKVSNENTIPVIFSSFLMASFPQIKVLGAHRHPSKYEIEIFPC